MARPDRIEGLAIVSADGMIADARGIQPDALKLEADQRFFHAMLDEADRPRPRPQFRRRRPAHGAAAPADPDPHASPASPAIRRTTRPCTGIRRAPTLEQAWEALGLSGGLLAVIGGTEPFGLFLESATTPSISAAPARPACPAAGRCSPASPRTRPRSCWRSTA